MGMPEVRPESGRRIDPFSRQVQKVTRARRVDVAPPLVGEAGGMSLLRHNTKSLDRLASWLEKRLDPSSGIDLSEEMHARLRGSLLTVKFGSEIIKKTQSGCERSIRESSADERVNTDPRIQKRRHDALRTALHTAVEDVLTDKLLPDMAAVALLSATTVVTGNPEDVAMASTHLQWLKHEAERLSASDPDFAVVAGMTEGILDIVRPVMDKTQALFAA